MQVNNNQSVAARLSKLPVVHSACTKLCLLYTDAKCRHPNLKAVCEGLEGSATALVSSVSVKLEPQICFANDIACKSLDWLETAFPVVKAPTGQIIATAQNKMHEIQDVLKTASSGTADYVQNSVLWLMGIEQVDGRADQVLMMRASMGLDSALTVSEAAMDKVLPPTNEEKAQSERFDSGAPRSPHERLVLLAARLYERISLMVMQNLTWSTDLVPSLQTLSWRIRELPQYMQHQFVSMLFFIVHMFNLSYSQSQRRQFNQDRNYVNADEKSTSRFMIPVDPEATSSTLRMRRPKKLVFDSGCNVKRCACR